ncbi:tautomerase family protein [Campylobacter cuniculorum]|uniref:4-oxalocrotonate tautomerase family enzyme n=2 Tax=Campylobacter cuniculorum TaxID=374106 RepID=A0A1W6BYU1_9BACT|nr:4-oxalocrotonate tautomerase family protein [Campylobacter cuniculorum]ARJ57279.1 4-oxalocrotonate tautomerase family enzyme [Campylobacter cuniculorum DSM 23162 = LMG 24588]QOR04715.1 4-oxalocrotonate tautomerase family protein [Campylobacter cuniculorum]
MPIVTIKLAKPAMSKEQKAALISDITELLNKKYNKAKERIVIMIEESEPFDIGFGGESVESIKAKEAKNE